MPTLQVYSRPGCHLCEVLIEELLPLVRGVLAVEVRNVESSPDWLAKYDIRVPVVEYEDRLICQYTLDREAISDLLGSLPEATGE
ncbi:MAG: glutaredoxin family protein [Gammaproteobacteria bacterium]|nr:glutaredoxin family protein [Gammaproteobacteria bacterium]